MPRQFVQLQPARTLELREDSVTEEVRFDSLCVPFSNDASESDMAGRRIDRLRVTRGGAVAAAVIWRAQMRAAFENFARNRNGRLARIVATGFGTAARIFRNAERFRRVGLVFR